MTYPLTPNNVENFDLYKCAVKNCKNKGSIEAKIRFLKKSGKFCRSCIKELEKQGLIEEEEKSKNELDNSKILL